MEPITKKWKTEKLKNCLPILLSTCSEVLVNSPGSVESVLKKKRKASGGKDLQKRKVLSLE